MSTIATKDIQVQADEHYTSRFGEISRLLRTRRHAEKHDHYEWVDAINQRLEEMPLSVDLIAHYPNSYCEWSILLGTGGPADRVLVETDEHGEPVDASYQFQDWFEEWPNASHQLQDYDDLREFASVFYFGCKYCELDQAEERGHRSSY